MIWQAVGQTYKKAQPLATGLLPGGRVAVAELVADIETGETRLQRRVLDTLDRPSSIKAQGHH